MTLDSIDLTLWLAGIAMEAILLGLVIWKRVYRKLPFFSCFFVWCLLSDGGMAIAVRYPNAYMAASVANISIDALFQLAMLAELGRAVLRHNQMPPPNKIFIGLLAVLAVVLAACLNKWHIPVQYPPLDTVYLVLIQLFAVLRVVFLLTLVWWSSLRGLRWPTRELRIVTGLGAYIIATLIVAILHSRDMVGMQYHWVDQVLVGIYLWTLAYWILAATTKVVEHQ